MAGERIYLYDTTLRDGAQQEGLNLSVADKLVIAAGTSTIQYLLPELVRRYRERHPAVHLQLANVTGKDGVADRNVT